MATNPSFIGHDSEPTPQRVDRLTSRIGYKVVSIAYDKQDKMHVQPPHYSDKMFELSDESSCEKGKSHRDLISCSCGFYAYNSLEAGIGHWTNACAKAANEWIVEVALSGEVVVAEKGYRATHQRITRIFLPHCFQIGCARRGEVLAYHQVGHLVPACKEHAGQAKQLTFQEFSDRYSPEGFNPIQIVASQNLSKDIDLFRRDEDVFREMTQLIDKYAAAGKTALLSQTVDYASKKLEESFGLDGLE